MIRLQRGTNGFLRPKKIIMKNLQKRTMRLLAIIIILGFGATIFGMAYTQLYKGDFFKTKAETQQLSDTAITAQRGIIYDANMSVLAQSASAWKISLNATAFADIPAQAQEKVYSTLSSVLGVSRKYLEDKASYKQYNSVSIKTKVEKEAKDKLEAFIKGTFLDKDNQEQSFGSIVMIDEDVKRYYPYSTLASQILGFTGTDNNGLSGIEEYYNSTLTGVDGRVISARSNSSVAQDIEYKSVYEAKQGTSLVLTIDETIQRYLENALFSCYETSKAASCTGIVMDVKTGAILAMSSKGDYDPNDPTVGLVHRIDKDTSGLLVVAKNADSKTHLGKQFFNKTTKRLYNALVWGSFQEEEGRIEGNIARHPKDRMQMAVFPPDSEIGKHAVTHYRVLENFNYVTLVECRLETGRTHQIRAHMKHIGHPLFNDERYGGNEILRGTQFSKYKQFIQNCFAVCPRQALHARTLGFIHPRSGQEMYFTSELPADMTALLERWRSYTAHRDME